MDFKKVVSAAMFPTIMLVVVGVAGIVLGLLSGRFLPLGAVLIAAVGMLLGFGFFSIECLVLLWGGYSAVRKHQLDWPGAALAGALSGVVSCVINAVIQTVLAIAQLAPSASSNPIGTAGGAAIAGGFMLVGIAIGIVVWAVTGAVLGAIGGFIAGITKPREKPEAKKPKKAGR